MKTSRIPIALAVAVFLVLATGCVPTESAVTEPEDPVIQLSTVGKRWGAGCNDALLEGPFALGRAVDFKVPSASLGRIDQVIEEVRGGYGGTLVTEPRDELLDSTAFLAHYLRAFSSAVGGSAYDYRFERILERLARTESVLQDPRLDWDIYRSFLLYEDFVAAAANGDDSYTTEGVYVHNLDSAKDLLWMYLTENAPSIRKDKDRLRWWLNSLTDGVRAAGGRPLRRWFLLQLIASTDTKTPRPKEPEERGDGFTFDIRQSEPFDPFITVEGGFFDDDREHPPFAASIKAIANSQALNYEVWGIDPSNMPPTKAVQTDLAPRLSQIALASVICQESWSKKPHTFGASFFRPIGRRGSYCNVRLPAFDSHDGVFFFTYNARLYVWPKERMDDGVVQLLHVSGLIDDEGQRQFMKQGFKRLDVTASGDVGDSHP